MDAAFSLKPGAANPPTEEQKQGLRQVMGVQLALPPGNMAKADLMSVAFTTGTGNPAATAQAISVCLPTGVIVAIAAGTQAPLDTGSLVAGTDYTIHATSAGGLVTSASFTPPAGGVLLGGFHYAPGGNAAGTSGGNSTPAANPYSFWDQKWRPACLDPRGMALVAGRFWMDIYLTNENPQVNGTSKHGVNIADDSTRPIIPTAVGGNGSTRYGNYNWFTACETLGVFGKCLPTTEEFALALYGVTEGTSRGTDPVTCGLDAARTSKWGMMQATGNLWAWAAEAMWRQSGDTVSAAPTATELFGVASGNVWGWRNITGSRGQQYANTPSGPSRALVGGSWNDGGNAGSRTAYWSRVATSTSSLISSRGRSDHMIA